MEVHLQLIKTWDLSSSKSGGIAEAQHSTMHSTMHSTAQHSGSTRCGSALFEELLQVVSRFNLAGN